jgi:hypothetical protein
MQNKYVHIIVITVVNFINLSSESAAVTTAQVTTATAATVIPATIPTMTPFKCPDGFVLSEDGFSCESASLVFRINHTSE